MVSMDLRKAVREAVGDAWHGRTFESYADLRDTLADAASDRVIELVSPLLPHGGEHCTCPVPCETCGATALTGYPSGCEECSERRQCAVGRVEFGDAVEHEVTSYGDMGRGVRVFIDSDGAEREQPIDAQDR